MPDKPSNLNQFWKELKRRKVIRRNMVYAASGFVILEFISIIVEPLGLPDWTLKLVLFLLCIGFVISIILSWFYDFTSDGIVRIKSDRESEKKSSENPSRLIAWKIATYLSVFIIVGLVLIHIFGDTKKNVDTTTLDKSIAVLPFNSLSDDPDKQYLADGVWDEIILHLTNIQDLRVLPRTSTEKYRETVLTATEICQELGVSHLLEGSFRQYGDQARLIVRLIRSGGEDNVLWNNQYDRDWKDIFSVEDQVAQLIATDLQAAISPKEKSQMEKIPTSSMTAYDLYLKGIDDHWSFWKEWDVNFIYQSIRNFTQAIELDTMYSNAYTGLGRAYWMLGHFAADRSADHWLTSLKYLNKAISLDSTNGWAYSELGVVLNAWAWDSIAAREAFDKAMEMSPNRRDVLGNYTYLAERTGDCKKLNSLLVMMRDRFQIDVSSDLNGFNLRLLTCMEDFKSISRIADSKWNNNTGYPQTIYLIDACIIEGNYDKARELIEFMEVSFDELKYGAGMTGLTYRGILYAMEGNQSAAENTIEQLVTLSNARPISPINMASIYLALGDFENSKSYLEQALTKRDFYIHDIQHIAPFYLHRYEPWLKDIIRRSWIPWQSQQTSIE